MYQKVQAVLSQVFPRQGWVYVRDKSRRCALQDTLFRLSGAYGRQCAATPFSGSAEFAQEVCQHRPVLSRFTRGYGRLLRQEIIGLEEGSPASFYVDEAVESQPQFFVLFPKPNAEHGRPVLHCVNNRQIAASGILRPNGTDLDYIYLVETSLHSTDQDIDDFLT